MTYSMHKQKNDVESGKIELDQQFYSQLSHFLDDAVLMWSGQVLFTALQIIDAVLT